MSALPKRAAWLCIAILWRKDELQRSSCDSDNDPLWTSIKYKQTLSVPVATSLMWKCTKYCVTSPLFFFKWYTVWLLMYVPLVAKHCMTSNPPFIFFFYYSHCLLLVILSLSSLNIDLICLFSLSTIPFSLFVCISFIPSSASPPHPHLPSSARLYQGLGKSSCVSTGCLENLRHVHDCLCSDHLT